jgi:acetyl-CoA carboxylase biotin carboxyl carrier protein
MDLSKIQELLKLMESHNLGELELQEKDLKVRLKKAEALAHAAPPPPVLGATAAAQPVAGAQPAPAEAAAANTHTITSPIVGTFYRAPSPEAETFVDLGDPVEVDTVVCIVEAMKVMNEVKAEVHGTISKILVESGRPVEYGQPLFVVAR